MPAYKGRLRGEETDDLVAYVLAVSHFGNLEDERAASGRDAATRLGCFGCHEPEGRGLTRLAKGLRAELVQGDGELKEWVRNGVSERLRKSPPPGPS
jgi:mono/diheme cytochrome c family protein